MTSPITALVGIQFISGPDTPPEWIGYNGAIIAVPPEYMTALGSGSTNPGVLLGVRGFLQNGGPTGKQWVMTGLITAAMRAQFAAIPGAHGWLLQASSDTYVTYGTALLNPPYNATGPDVMGLLQALYTAAVNNDRTKPPGG